MNTKYRKPRARNAGFHNQRHVRTAAFEYVQKALTRIGGITLVTVKRHARAFKAFAEQHFPNGLEHIRARRPGVLTLARPARSTREPQRLRAVIVRRAAEIG